jgi:hypothetical protein
VAVLGDRWLLWVLRAAWLIAGVAAWSGVDALQIDSSSARLIVLVAGGLAWLAVVLSLAILSPLGLTLIRLMIPLSIPASVVLLVAGGESVMASSLVLLATGSVATVLAMSAEIGGAALQASAYGDEIRLGLRPPLGYLVAALVAWVLWAAAVMAAAILVLSQRWVAAAVLAVVAIALGVIGWMRWHLLARRWLVLVPVGLVVHDPLMLTDTIMIRRSELAGLALATANGEHLIDLSGPATGGRLVIETLAPIPVVPAPTRRGQRPAAIETTVVAIAPSRPGRSMSAAAQRRLPVVI